MTSEYQTNIQMAEGGVQMCLDVPGYGCFQIKLIWHYHVGQPDLTLSRIFENCIFYKAKTCFILNIKMISEALGCAWIQGLNSLDSVRYHSP